MGLEIVQYETAFATPCDIKIVTDFKLYKLYVF